MQAKSPAGYMRGPPEVYARYIRLIAPVYRSDRRRAVPRLARRHRVAARAAGRLPPAGSAMMLMRLAQLRLSWLRGVRRPAPGGSSRLVTGFLWCRRSPAGGAALGPTGAGEARPPGGAAEQAGEACGRWCSSNLHGGLARANRLSRSDDVMLSGHTFVAVAAGPMPAVVPSTVPGGQADGVSDVAGTSVAALRNESLVRWMCRASKSAAACRSRASTASSSCWCS